MSEPRTPYGDPDVFRTPVTLTIDISGRDRRLLAERFDLTAPATDADVRQWAERLLHALLAAYDPVETQERPLPPSGQDLDNIETERWFARMGHDPRDQSLLPESPPADGEGGTPPRTKRQALPFPRRVK